MNFLSRYIIFITLLFCGYTLQAQQFPQYTHYWANAEGYNPAYAGIMENGGSISGIYRSQWDALDGAPETQLISLILPNYNSRVGVGFSFQHDKLRPQKNLLINGNLGWQAVESGKTKLALGANVGIYDRRTELTNLRIVTAQDAQFFNDDARTYFNLGLGAHLYGDRWFIDASIPNIFNSPIDSGENTIASTKDALVSHFYLGAGYQFNIKGDIRISPRTLFKFTEGARSSWEVQAPIGYKDKFEVGPFIRLDDAAGIIASVDLLDKKFKLGYAYGASTTQLSDFNDGSHEMSLRYKIGNPLDTDEDGIPDNRDICPQTPGLKKFDGCPDTDMDGIKDSEDDCPTLPGELELNGCPDTDGDGITDNIDNCPEIPGLATLQGCPDADEDGITDAIDDCPDVFGLPSLKGCPDGDQDGVADRYDDCPTEGGDVDDNGCPLPIDSDQDGIIDDEDECPEVYGVINGCPDSDKDGIRDLDDKCPEEGGDIDAFGCPKPAIILSPAIQDIGGVLFDTDRTVLKSEFIANVEEIVAILQKNEGYKVIIQGHTDAVGNPIYNQDLSKRRSDRIKKYLLEKGIDQNRLSTTFSGEDNPRSDNTTIDGRKLNRRVEFEITDAKGNTLYRTSRF